MIVGSALDAIAVGEDEMRFVNLRAPAERWQKGVEVLPMEHGTEESFDSEVRYSVYQASKVVAAAIAASANTDLPPALLMTIESGEVCAEPQNSVQLGRMDCENVAA